MKTEVTAKWSHAILVCKKCSKKQAKRGHGYGREDKRLAAALNDEMVTGKSRKANIGVVEVPCMDVCPKGAVMLVDSRRPDQWRIIRPDADLTELAEELR